MSICVQRGWAPAQIVGINFNVSDKLMWYKQEVFLSMSIHQCSVIVVVSQIVPIEGDFKYNDEPQNTFQSMQPETVVTMWVYIQ